MSGEGDRRSGSTWGMPGLLALASLVGLLAALLPLLLQAGHERAAGGAGRRGPWSGAAGTTIAAVAVATAVAAAVVATTAPVATTAGAATPTRVVVLGLRTGLDRVLDFFDERLARPA